MGWLLFLSASNASSFAVCFRSYGVPASRASLFLAPFVFTILPQSKAWLRSGDPAPWKPGSPDQPLAAAAAGRSQMHQVSQIRRSWATETAHGVQRGHDVAHWAFSGGSQGRGVPGSPTDQNVE